jgi:hypothetical protein
MDDRLENKQVQSLTAHPMVSNIISVSNGQTLSSINIQAGTECGSADCACYGDNGCDDVDNGGGDIS